MSARTDSARVKSRRQTPRLKKALHCLFRKERHGAVDSRPCLRCLPRMLLTRRCSGVVVVARGNCPRSSRQLAAAAALRCPKVRTPPRPLARELLLYTTRFICACAGIGGLTRTLPPPCVHWALSVHSHQHAQGTGHVGAHVSTIPSARVRGRGGGERARYHASTCCCYGACSAGARLNYDASRAAHVLQA